MMILALTVLVAGFAGCSATGRHACNMNLKYMHDDVQRALGFDRPNALHPRDLISNDDSDPYRGYD